MQTTKSFFAARGDSELRGPNATLEALSLARSDFLDLTASRSNDGLWLHLVHREVKDLVLESSSINSGTWFRNSSLPTEIQLSFNSAVSEASVSNSTFKWVWSGGAEAVVASGITYSLQNRILTIPLPAGVTSAYVGQLTLVGDGFQNDNGERIRHPVKISMEMSATNVNLPQTGKVPHTAPGQSGGRMEVGRLVVAHGMSTDQMIGQFITQRRLESDSVLKIVQNRGPNGSVEIFLLWWLETSPKVTSLTPLPDSTTPSENSPDQIIMEFDQPVDQQYLDGDDGIDRVFVDDTRWQDLTAPVLSKLDEDGRVWMLSGLTEITTAGPHKLLIRQMPNQYGLYPGPPMLFSWQVQSLLVGGAAGSANRCETPTGAVDGINDEFELTFTPASCSLHLYLNGIFCDPSCYTLVDTTITMGSPPAGGSLYAIYLEA